MGTPPYGTNGTPTLWAAVNFGPTLGNVPRPVNNITILTAAGDYEVQPYDQMIAVKKTVPQATEIQLPDVALWMKHAYGGFPITIKDAGNNASSFNITILPFGSQTMDSLSTWTIIGDGGSVTFIPLEDLSGWQTL